VNLLMELQARLSVAYLFISHDMAVVERVAHRVAVMYLGQIVEIGAAEDLFSQPRHPYTRALLSAIPVPKPRAERERIVLAGELPSLLAPPPGCHFHTRCPHVIARCRTERPLLMSHAGSHPTACHRTAELLPARAVTPHDSGFAPDVERLVQAFCKDGIAPAIDRKPGARPA